jgi:hypothetical protein
MRGRACPRCGHEAIMPSKYYSIPQNVPPQNSFAGKLGTTESITCSRHLPVRRSQIGPASRVGIRSGKRGGSCILQEQRSKFTGKSRKLWIVLSGTWVTCPQPVIETLDSRIYAGVFHFRASRGRVFSFLATVSNRAWLTVDRSFPLG